MKHWLYYRNCAVHESLPVLSGRYMTLQSECFNALRFQLRHRLIDIFLEKNKNIIKVNSNPSDYK